MTSSDDDLRGLASDAQGPPTDWEGTAQAAARIGVSARKVRYWIEAKRIRARKATQDGREVWLVASSDVTSAAEEAAEGPRRSLRPRKPTVLHRARWLGGESLCSSSGYLGPLHEWEPCSLPDEPGHLPPSHDAGLLWFLRRVRVCLHFEHS